MDSLIPTLSLVVMLLNPLSVETANDEEQLFLDLTAGKKLKFGNNQFVCVSYYFIQFGA